VRDLEATLQRFSEFILRAKLVKEKAAHSDWVRRFLVYAAERQESPHPRIDSESVRDFLTHLAVRRHVSAITQNQALCAVLFLCREVLAIEIGGLALAVQAKRGVRLPMVLGVPETAALLGALRGTAWLMAALIHGGGLRVSECCELRIKDIDFDEGCCSCVAVKETRTGRPCSPNSVETTPGPPACGGDLRVVVVLGLSAEPRHQPRRSRSSSVVGLHVVLGSLSVLRKHPFYLLRVACFRKREHQENTSLLRIEIVRRNHPQRLVFFASRGQVDHAAITHPAGAHHDRSRRRWDRFQRRPLTARQSPGTGARKDNPFTGACSKDPSPGGLVRRTKSVPSARCSWGQTNSGNETYEWRLGLYSQVVDLIGLTELARRTGRFPQLVDSRSRVTGLLLEGSPGFRPSGGGHSNALAGASRLALRGRKLLLWFERRRESAPLLNRE
jgi:hypothetical protein